MLTVAAPLCDYDHVRNRACAALRTIRVDGVAVSLRLPHRGAWELAPYVAGRVDRDAWTTVAHG